MGCSHQTCTSAKECTADLRFQPELSLPEVKGQAQWKMTEHHQQVLQGKIFMKEKISSTARFPLLSLPCCRSGQREKEKIGMGWKIKTEEEKQKRNGEQHSIENTNKGTTSLIGG